MKYLIISDYACINGGCAKVAIQTAIGLSNEGKEVVLFAGGGKTDESLINSNVKVVNLNQKDLLNGNKLIMFFRGIKNNYAMKKLNDFLKTMKGDWIIHIHSWMKVLSPGIFKVLSKYKFKIYITAHDYFLLCPNGGFYNYKENRICELCDRKKCKKINCDSRNFIIKKWRYIRYKKQNKYMKNLNYNLITLSSLMKKQIDDAGIESSIIKNPIDMNECQNDITTLKSFKFAFVGRLSHEKGIEYYCEALKISGYEGYVFGNGVLYNEIKEKYNYPNIHFMGWMNFSEIREYFDEIGSLIFPSKWYEGAPLTIPEFGSYGIPSIVSSACSGVDYINEDTGIIFEDGNIDDLIKKMTIVSNDFKNFSKRIKVFKKTIDINHDLDDYIDEIVKIMR